MGSEKSLQHILLRSMGTIPSLSLAASNRSTRGGREGGRERGEGAVRKIKLKDVAHTPDHRFLEVSRVSFLAHQIPASTLLQTINTIYAASPFMSTYTS